MGEYYLETKNPSKNYADRYRSCKILKDLVTGEQLLATRETKNIATKSTDIYHEVKTNESCRLDIIAYNYYKNPLLWWVIAQANNIYDPIVATPVGTILRIPALETLYGNNGILL